MYLDTVGIPVSSSSYCGDDAVTVRKSIPGITAQTSSTYFIAFLAKNIELSTNACSDIEPIVALLAECFGSIRKGFTVDVSLFVERRDFALPVR